MAEFKEVMRQLGRICATNFGECDICDLRPYCPARTFLDKYAKSGRVERLEEMVLSWAAEHPEPVYPMWCEWLADKGVVDVARMPVDYSGGIITEIKPSGKMYEHIPADLAEKLGIDPKEG